MAQPKMRCFVGDSRRTAMEKLSDWTEEFGCFGGRNKQIVDVKIVKNSSGENDGIIVLYEDN